MTNGFVVLKVEGSTTSLEGVCDAENEARTVATDVAQRARGKAEVLVYQRFLRLEVRPNIVTVEEPPLAKPFG